MLEPEFSNVTAQTLYQDCVGFIREELLVRYYLNSGDASITILVLTRHGPKTQTQVLLTPQRSQCTNPRDEEAKSTLLGEGGVNGD
jgi:hypothetical protein